MLKNIIFLTVLTIYFLPTNCCAKSYKVALFIPGESSFWTLVTNFMQEAANDLSIELQVYNADSSHIRMLKQVKKAISGPNKVDAIVFQNFKKQAPKIIKMAEKAHVYAYLFNSPIQNGIDLGEPREYYKYWIGQMLPDDRKSTNTITKILINEIEKKGNAKHEKIEIIGITGRIADTSSIYRVKGLMDATKNKKDIVLNQIFNTDWSEEQGYDICLKALDRYPNTSIIWSANYKITDGILKCIETHNKTHKHIFTNSIGLSAHTLKQIDDRKIIVSTGGHYMDAAWVLVELYDFFHGVDFVKDGVSTLTIMPIVTKDNVDIFRSKVTSQKFSKENLKKINYKQYSKTLNPHLDTYSFSLESVLNQL